MAKHEPSSADTKMPEDTAYRTLSRSTLFPNLDQYQYWHRAAPMLSKMLSDGEYSVHRQYEYLSVFAHLVLPMLGPFPDARDLYKCVLGGIGSLELSQNFQPDGSTVRLAFEPTSYMASTGGDPFNRNTINATLAKLKALDIGVNLQLHQMLVHELTLTDSEEQLVSPKEMEKMIVKTQTLLAFDLTKSGICVKEYFYPDIKSNVTGASVAQIIFAAIEKMDRKGHFEAPCQLLRSHMQRQSIDDLHFASCDLVDPLQTRIKVYLAELDVTLAKMTEHWTLSGMATDEETLEGLQMVRELWVELGIVEGKRIKPDRPAQPGDPNTHLPVLLNYEMSPGRPCPKPKIYYPLTGISDMRIANVLTAFFQRHGMQNHSAAYIKNFKSYYPDRNLDVATDHQAWLSFSYTKKKGPYLTMYYH
ncbi:aromatic prenyltransferase [Aspergillus floccosus]